MKPKWKLFQNQIKQLYHIQIRAGGWDVMLDPSGRSEALHKLRSLLLLAYAKATADEAVSVNIAIYRRKTE